MIIVGAVIVLLIFLVVGWAVATEMFQQRTWRNRVRSGDTDIIGALIEEALNQWRRSRPPKELPSSLWAGVQGAQLVAVTAASATLSAAAEASFRTENGARTQVASALDESIALASKLIDMMLYDVPNLRLGSVRVDIYSTFAGADGTPVQQPIVSSTAHRAIADELPWESLTPAEILGRFETIYQAGEAGRPVAITLPPIEGALPRPAEEAAAELQGEQLKDND
ncbi:hypothetical protein J0H33_16440 [bacterium]|nr:hypothetical protein [bacterium]